MEWFPGKPSSDLDSKSERREAAIMTGIKLRKMHEVRMSGFGWPDAKNKWSGKSIKFTINFFVKRIQNFLKKANLAFSKDELTAILQVTRDNKKLLSFTEPRLLHGDITGGNVIVLASKEIALIDTGELIAGDPMSDLGYSQNTRLSPIFREGVWKGYVKNTPLTAEEHDRFLRWRLIRQCIIACRAVLRKDKNMDAYINDARLFMKELKG